MTDETGVVDAGHWAYCNRCQWTGPTRPLESSASFDLALHVDQPAHAALSERNSREHAQSGAKSSASSRPIGPEST